MYSNTSIMSPGRGGLPVREGRPEPVGRACPVGEAAPRAPRLPRPDLRGGPSGAGAGPPDPRADSSGPNQGAQLPAGPGLAPAAAPVLLHHGARPAGAAAPEGHSGPGCAGEAEVEEPAMFGNV